MEFHDLGKQCSFPECKQLDFLPFSCPHCGLVFCKDHYLPDHHNCIASSLASNLQSTEPTNSYFQCSDSNCTATSAVALLCPVCKHHFCISHRHHGCLDKSPTEEDIKRWNTPREQFHAAKSEVDRQVSLNLRKKANIKGNVTAMKIQLMRLKGRAKGSSNVPVSERSYFLVYPPLQCSMSSQAVFVGRLWTLGRVIDAIADSCKVPNRNNEATAPKLRLFDYVNGQMLSPLTQTIQNLFDVGSIFDGSSLVLEYVPGDNVEIDSLINVALYKE
ncbi:hypothetical protein R5R35_011380 [Gryllus longicercus]|uniref:AN1-type domain-containing protein n=1 Tax=Gryllus longicercus TaxID=2509291 RepID=A0AAN9W454_9ORTH